MPIHLLRNPQSGRGTRRNETSEERLASVFEGNEVVDLTRASADASSDALAQAVKSGEIERLVVAGGDGLVHLAIQHVAESGVPMKIVPTGTGNDFAMGARKARGPMAPDGTIEIDLLRVSTADDEPRWVASIVIAGFPAAINARANAITVPLGSFVYTAAAIVELPRFSRAAIDYQIETKSGRVSRTTDSAMLAIGNTRYFGGGMLACPDALADDGLLHFTSIEGVGRIGVLRHLQQRRGGSADRREVQRHTGSRVTLTSDGIDLWGDGEPLGTSPAMIEVVPKALILIG